MEELTREGCGARTGPALLRGTRKGALGLSCCGLGNAKGIGHPAACFLPWPRPPCSSEALQDSSLPQDSASHQPRPNNSHKSGRRLPACCWALSGPWGEQELFLRPRGCFWVNHELERGEWEAAWLELSSCWPWPGRQTVRRGQKERGGSRDTWQLPAEKGAGVKAVASWGAASPGGPSGRDARLLVAWGASYAKHG